MISRRENIKLEIKSAYKAAEAAGYVFESGTIGAISNTCRDLDSNIDSLKEEAAKLRDRLFEWLGTDPDPSVRQRVLDAVEARQKFFRVDESSFRLTDDSGGAKLTLQSKKSA